MSGQERYSRVAALLHWAIAAFILFNLGFGFFMEGMPREWKGIILPLHISSGVTVLALTALRVLWRLTHRPPPLLPAPQWQHLAAHAVHGLLYLLMVGMPLTGIAILSCHPAHPPPGAPGAPKVWGLIETPAFSPLQELEPAAQKAAHDQFVTAHSVLGWILLAMLVLHVGAALKHQFLDGQPQFRRMGFTRR
jgi:cytochrome b561